MERETARLLIVEDEEEIREALREWFAAQACRIVCVDSGPAALAETTASDFDLVLLDVGLPGLDGFEVLAKLRETWSATALPVIMLTGHASREAILRGLRLGANDYVTKPFDPPIVLARVQTQLALKRAVEQTLRLELDIAWHNGELQIANEALSAANAEMRADLDLAGRLQRAMLPTAPPAVAGLECAWRFQPCEALGGDMFNVVRLDEHHVALHMLDVSGHGVKAALLSVSVQRLLMPVADQPGVVQRRNAAGELEPTPPADVATELNRRFQLEDDIELYFTLFYGVLDLRTGALRYVCAGLPGPLLLPRDGPPRDLTEPVFAIGWLEGTQYEERRLELRPGDRLFILSDGILEARGPGNEYLGPLRAIDALARASSEAPLCAAIDEVVLAAEAWSDGLLDDDVSALAIRFTPARTPARTPLP